MDEAWFLYATEFRNSAKVWPKHSWLITPTHYGRQMKSKWSCSTSLETPNPRCQEIACFPCHCKEVASWGWQFLLVAKPGKFKVGWVAESSNLQDCWMEWWNIFFILAVQGGACDPVDKYHIDPYSQGKNCIVFPSRGGHNYILKPAGRLTHTCDQRYTKWAKPTEIWRDREKLLSHTSGAPGLKHLFCGLSFIAGFQNGQCVRKVISRGAFLELATAPKFFLKFWRRCFWEETDNIRWQIRWLLQKIEHGSWFLEFLRQISILWWSASS